VSRLFESAGESRAEIEFSLVDADGTVVVEGTAEFAVG
jgi:hypothetical protein